jgi:hypothetical protein
MKNRNYEALHYAVFCKQLVVPSILIVSIVVVVVVVVVVIVVVALLNLRPYLPSSAKNTFGFTQIIKINLERGLESHP